MMNVTLYENSCFQSTNPKTVPYDPYKDTLETLLKQNYPTVDKKHFTVACGNEKFLDFTTPVNTCLHYGRSISIFNHLLNLTIKPNVEEWSPIQIQVDSRDLINEVFKKVRYNYDCAKFKLCYNGKDLNNRFIKIKEYSLENNAVIDLQVNQSDLQTREGTYRIWLINWTNDKFQLNVHNTDTAYDIKKIIQDYEGMPIFKQRLIFDGQRMIDKDTLEDHDVIKDDCLRLYLELVGGGSFVDFEKAKPRAFGCSKSAPEWRTVTAGLCFEGKCLNQKCKAFERMVIINMGTPIIYQFGVSNSVETKCPQCDSLVQPKTCAFNNCKWRFYGVKQTPTGPKRVNCEWKNVGDEYHRFDDDEESFCEWNSLVIETSYLSKWTRGDSNDYSRSTASLTKSDICAICLDDNNDKMYKLDCKHEFHVGCFKEWIKFTPSPNCPLCRSVW